MTAELTLGIRSGILVVALALPLAFAWRWTRRGPLPAAGVLLGVAGVIGLQEVIISRSQPDPLPRELVVGLLLLAAAGLVLGLLRISPVVVGMALAAPGAWVVADAGGPTSGWIRLLVVVGVAAGGALAADFDRRWAGVGAPPILLAISIAGLYLAVPETVHVSVVLGVALPVALLGLGAVAGLGSPGAFVAVGLFVWAAAMGGAARPSSIVGGLGCLGLLVVEPLIRAFGGGRSGLELLPRRWRLTVLIAIQAALAVFASRVAGVQPTAGAAGLLVLAEWGLVVVLVGASGRTATPSVVVSGQRARGEGRVADRRV